MLAQTIDLGRRPSPDEVIAVLEEELAERAPLRIDTEALLDDRDSGRPG